MTLGEKIQTLRKTKGISQEQLAAQMAVSRQAVSKWEVGESNPDIDNIVQLSKIFGVTTDYLLTESSSQSSPEPSAGKGESAVAGRILYIASVAFLAIGLLCAFGDWYENQSDQSIWGSMIIQVVGVVSYFIGKQLTKRPPPQGILLANWALALFMPISMLSCQFFGYPISPYPTDFKIQLVFGALYLLAMGVCLYLFKKKRPSH